MTEQKALRGFATWSPEKRRAAASKGGKNAHALGVAHEFTSEEASAAAKIGGTKVSQDREYMAIIGRIGGLKSRPPRRKKPVEE